MIENNETEVINNGKNETKSGFSIASMVLGIVALVMWCMWYLSIPCSILALIFGILGVKKAKKGMAIAGIVTGSIALAIWLFLFIGAFSYGFIQGFTETMSSMY